MRQGATRGGTARRAAGRRRDSRGAALRAAIPLVLAGLLATGCSGGAEPAEPVESDAPEAGEPAGTNAELPPLPARFTDQALDWEHCPAPSPRQGSGEPPGDAWRCSTLTVPLDYARPEADTIELALIRAEADDPADRIGSLVFNFGGPGGSGVASLPRSAERYAELRTRYDLVSFDPRGVGESSGVVCRDDAEIDAAAQRATGPPRTDAEVREFLSANRDHAIACADRNGDLLGQLGTVQAARDLDLLRQVLGERQLHYFGISYGTKLGAVHAHLFPDRVGRTVLDAVVDPTRDQVERLLLQTEGFQLALDNYLTDCAQAADCPTGGAGPEGYAAINALLESAREQPLPTDSGRLLTQDLAVTGLLASLYSAGSWPYLTEAIREATEEGRGDLLLRAAEQYNGRDTEGRYRNVSAANTAINCADFASRPTLETVEEYRDTFVETSPVFGESLVWGLLSCLNWPVNGERDQPVVHAEGAGPILLLATTGDPATPRVGAERMRGELGPGVGVLLTYEGEGHGAFSSGDPCVTGAVTRYLLVGDPPGDGTVCA
ncbi:alpha/beta hydrolase [Streptomyces sp. DSM 44915]|uniref:Alpha/beta hydrolase n=1 Tax=Streptomyces chisholmiae TaxID=3075540 RepID=A0ABU2JKG9_9ACTN|nr:alpha/beta hydrolase [Streptomyces sp. DSM 44915]MDT0265482.1 alpha/beta hydrolase [Streptomyces sp. DSM 44915]